VPSCHRLVLGSALRFNRVNRFLDIKSDKRPPLGHLNRRQCAHIGATFCGDELAQLTNHRAEFLGRIEYPPLELQRAAAKWDARNQRLGSLEKNFREKFETLNRVNLTDAEFQRLRDELITPEFFTARVPREKNDFKSTDKSSSPPSRSAASPTRKTKPPIPDAASATATVKPTSSTLKPITALRPF
jgi:hypothetical protein